MQDIKENEFSIAARNALSLKVGGLAKFDVESINKNDIEFIWEIMYNNYYGGIIIEEFVNEDWVRVARIGDSEIRNARIRNRNSRLEHEFRAKTFYIDGSAALYSDYEYLKILKQ